MLLDVGDNSGVGDTALSVSVMFCGRTWTITSDNEKLSV